MKNLSPDGERRPDCASSAGIAVFSTRHSKVMLDLSSASSGLKVSLSVRVVSLSRNSLAHCLAISPGAFRTLSHVCSAYRFSADIFMTVVGTA